MLQFAGGVFPFTVYFYFWSFEHIFIYFFLKILIFSVLKTVYQTKDNITRNRMNEKKSYIFTSIGVLAILCFLPIFWGGRVKCEFRFFIVYTISFSYNKHSQKSRRFGSDGKDFFFFLQCEFCVLSS